MSGHLCATSNGGETQRPCCVVCCKVGPDWQWHCINEMWLEKKLNCCFTRFHSLCFVDVSEITPKKDKNNLDLDHRCTHCTGESSRSDGSNNSSNNNNRSHFGFGWRHTSVTPLTKTHLPNLEAVVQVFCFYGFFQKKINLLSSIITAWLNLYIFFVKYEEVFASLNSKSAAITHIFWLFWSWTTAEPALWKLQDPNCICCCQISLQIAANHDYSNCSSD